MPSCRLHVLCYYWLPLPASLRAKHHPLGTAIASTTPPHRQHRLLEPVAQQKWVPPALQCHVAATLQAQAPPQCRETLVLWNSTVSLGPLAATAERLVCSPLAEWKVTKRLATCRFTPAWQCRVTIRTSHTMDHARPSSQFSSLAQAEQRATMWTLTPAHASTAEAAAKVQDSSFLARRASALCFSTSITIGSTDTTMMRTKTSFRLFLMTGILPRK